MNEGSVVIFGQQRVIISSVALGWPPEMVVVARLPPTASVTVRSGILLLLLRVGVHFGDFVDLQSRKIVMK